jgi:hypothetical protein
MKRGLFSLLTIAAIGLLSLIACDDTNRTTEQIPTGPVNINIDLNLPAYMHLANPGTHHAYFDGGVKGVLVIHDYDDTWFAFERGCAFEPLVCLRQGLGRFHFDIQLQCGTPTSTGFQTLLQFEI